MNPLPKLDPDPIVTLADGIRKISDSANAMRQSGLNRHALIVLLQSRTDLPQRDIAAVLDSLESMKADWLSKAPCE